MHNWLLVHDDVEDGDRMRRGMPALWVKYGVAHGVNVGDMMAHKVFELILRSKIYGVDDATTLRLVDAMATTAIKTSEGQAMDINLRNSVAPIERDYMKMVQGKTGHYLTVSLVGGAIVAGADDKLVKRIIAYGNSIGPAFQIQDDLLDLTEGKGRGEIGRDIKEGKRSMLVVHALSKCTTPEGKKLISILSKPAADVKWAKSLFVKYKSVDYAKKRAEELIEQGKQSVRDVDPKLREILYFFADYMVKRKK